MKLRTRKQGRVIAGLGLLLAGALALAGCAQSSSDTGTTDGSSESSSDATANLELANQKVEEYSSFDQTFPTIEPFTPVAGTVDVVSQGMAAEVVGLNAQRAVEGFEAAGWDVRGPFDGEFSAPVIGGFIDTAVAEGRDAMLFVSANLQDVGQSVTNALDSGLVMVCVMCPYFEELADAGLIYSTINFETQGEILAWYMVQQSGAEGRLMSLEDPGSYATVLRANGFNRIVSDNCDTCELMENLIQPSSDVGLPGPPQWSAFLSANPPGTPMYVNSMADVVGLPMVKTLQSIGRTDIFIGGFDADVEAIDMIRSGDTPFIGTVALPYYWGDWAGVDLVMRAVSGVELWDASDLPMQLVTLENVSEFTEFTPGADWQDEFKAAWGVN